MATFKPGADVFDETLPETETGRDIMITGIVVPNADKLARAYQARGYPLGNFNVFGIRNSDVQSNGFNDVVGVLYRAADSDPWLRPFWHATTDPGLYYREHPMNVHGTAMLKPGHYAKAFRIGEHKGQPALVQNAPLTVYRDNNRNKTIDVSRDATETGMFGIDIHRANPVRESVQVDKWSAGCQVVANPHDFAALLRLCIERGGPFDYTLWLESDFA